MNLSGHSNITRDAVLSINHPALKGALLEKIVSANIHEDDDQVSSSHHFDNCAFHEGDQKIRKDRDVIFGESDRLSRRSVEALGRILHTVQDFYAHSNWIEVHLGDSPVPLWNLDPATLPKAVCSGTWTQGKPRCHRTPACPTHGELNKDSDSSGMGKLVIKSGPNEGKTHWDLARKAAVEASVEEVKWLLHGTTDYRVTVKTGDRDQAGTDADVFLVLHGPKGEKTGKIYLDNLDHNDFERNNEDEFRIAVRGAPHEIASITIGYDQHSEGSYAGWYLEWVKVEDVKSGKSYWFKAGRWLADEEADEKTVVDLPVTPM